MKDFRTLLPFVSEALEQTESSGGEFIFLSSSLSFLNADGGALNNTHKVLLCV